MTRMKTVNKSAEDILASETKRKEVNKRSMAKKAKEKKDAFARMEAEIKTMKE